MESLTTINPDQQPELLRSVTTGLPEPVQEKLTLEKALNRLAKAAKNLTLREALSGPEKVIISERLKKYGGNVSKTAKDLGISRPTLYELMNRYGLEWR